MYNRMAGMLSKYGSKHYGFTPKSFVLPNETSALMKTMHKNRD